MNFAKNPVRLLRTSTIYPLIALVLAMRPLSAEAQGPEGISDAWRTSMYGIGNCVGSLQNTGNEITAATDCAIDRVFSQLAGAALQFFEQHGKRNFGEHFHIDRRLGLTASSGTFSADLDVVVPLTALSFVKNDTTTRSFFAQSGVTRWQDGHGFQRSDMRHGFVLRSALHEKPGDGVLGASLFFQQNLERGHARIVAGVEYLDRWGQSSFRELYTKVTSGAATWPPSWRSPIRSPSWAASPAGRA